MDWNEGYRTDVAYTHGYYSELNPCIMRFLMLVAGFIPPEISTACELGYGQGISLNIHAAAESIAWTGTDFNPSQAAFASDLARASGANCLSDSFQRLLERDDLPDFDFITLHGIWSWTSRESQQAITRFIDKKLRVGGTLYISYNSNPGWAAFKPMRDLMLAVTETLPAETPQNKTRNAFAFIENFLALKPGYAAANPQVEKRIAQLRGKDPAYLVHEFLNGRCEPYSFAEMANTLGEARMSYACAAQPMLVAPGVGLTPEQLEFVKNVNDPILRESLIDFIRNTQFRKDYWIKGPRRMGKLARIAALHSEQVILLVQPEKILPEFKVSNGYVKMKPGTHKILLSVLGDGRPHTLAELEHAAIDLASQPDAPAGADKENLDSICMAVCSLLAAGFAGIVSNTATPPENIRIACAKLNAMLEALALQNADVTFLASPVTGGGIPVSRFEMLFLLSLRQGAKTTDDATVFVRDCLAAAGHTIIKDGKKLENADELLAHLREHAEKFVAERLPVLKKLLIV